MAGKIGKPKVKLTLTIILSLAIVLMAPPPLATGIVYEVGSGEPPTPVYDLSAVPQSVADDAAESAAALFGDYPEKANDFASQLLTTYLEVMDKDFVVVFNPGGWGWNLLEASPDWHSILTGIQIELTCLGYTLQELAYLRTDDTWGGRLDELMEMVSLYPSKAEDLARRVEFLTTHIPELKVIIAGESNGTIICDKVMNILKDNPKVYSIQTGRPFWHKNIMSERTLALTDNGIIPDSFSHGDFFTIICANLEALFGFPGAGDNPGKILNYVGSPGHEYWWQYPGVHSRITSFLEQNFTIKQ